MTTDPAAIPITDPSARSSVAHRSRVSRSTGWLAGAVPLSLWGYAIYRLGSLWYSNKAYAYGWFVSLLCASLFWERWQRRPAREAIQGSTGTLILWGALGLALLPSCLFLEVIPSWRFAGWGFAGIMLGITFCALYLIGGRS